MSCKAHRVENNQKSVAYVNELSWKASRSQANFGDKDVTNSSNSEAGCQPMRHLLSGSFSHACSTLGVLLEGRYRPQWFSPLRNLKNRTVRQHVNL